MATLKSFDWALEINKKKKKASANTNIPVWTEWLHWKMNRLAVFAAGTFFPSNAQLCQPDAHSWLGSGWSYVWTWRFKEKCGSVLFFFSMHLSFTFNLTLTETLCYHHNFPDPKVTSTNGFFCPASSLKPKESLFTVIGDKDRQRILTMKRFKFDTFTCKNDGNNESVIKIAGD